MKNHYRTGTLLLYMGSNGGLFIGESGAFTDDGRDMFIKPVWHDGFGIINSTVDIIGVYQIIREVDASDEVDLQEIKKDYPEYFV